jgi:mono/diheme cytochrome c family protein
MNKLLLALLACLLLAFGWGCQPQNQTNQSQSQTENVSLTPEQTYANNCAACHGQNLEGGMGPELKKVGSKMDAEQIAQIIAEGRNGMPSQPQVTAGAREKLAAWLAEKK